MVVGATIGAVWTPGGGANIPETRPTAGRETLENSTKIDETSLGEESNKFKNRNKRVAAEEAKRRM